MRRLTLAAVLLMAVTPLACHAVHPESQWVGTYRFAHGPDEEGFEVKLLSDGSARSNAGGPGTLTRGHWKQVDGAARIEWQDGWKNQLSFVEGHWIQRSWPPGVDFSSPPIKEVRVRKEP
jgi:hypothetical protein